MAQENSTLTFPVTVAAAPENLELTTSFSVSGRGTGPVIVTVNYILLIISVIIVVCDAITIHVLTKCRRIPRRCLYFSISFILSDAVNSALFSCFQLSIYCFNYYNDIIHYSRIFVIGIMNNISSASMAAVSLERVIVLKANIKYTNGLNATCVKLIIVIVWILHVIFVVMSLAVGVGIHCNWKLYNCDFWDATRIARFTVIGIMAFYDIILVCSNVFIYRTARRHVKNILAMKRMAFSNTISNPDTISERQYATTRAVIYIVLAYLILQAPINIHIAISETRDTIRHELFMRVFLGVSYICLQVHTFVNLYLYVGKFKECKMLFYFTLARFFKRFHNRAELLRLDVFNIVVSSEVGKSSRSASTT